MTPERLSIVVLLPPAVFGVCAAAEVWAREARVVWRRRQLRRAAR